MVSSARPKECESFKELVPVYVEYILTGREMPARSEVEEHIADCRRCGAVYADLLGVWVVEQVEHILDLSLVTQQGEETTGAPETREGDALDQDLALDVALHWSEVAGDDRNAASALACIGTLLEQRGESARAQQYYDDALSLAETAGNGYARARSLGGRGRIRTWEGRKAEAVASLREACRQDSAMKDEFGLVRDTIALGDVLSGSTGIRGRLEALRCYVRASMTASGIEYSAGRDAAEARLTSYRDSLAAYFRSLIGGFVENRLRKERVLLDDLCRGFVSQLGEALVTGRGTTPQPALSRLGFGGAVGDLKSPALLSTLLTASSTMDFRDIAANIEAAEGSVVAAGRPVRRSSEAYRAAVRDLTAVARDQGLGKKEAEDFSKYLLELIVNRPELGSTGFDGVEGNLEAAD